MGALGGVRLEEAGCHSTFGGEGAIGNTPLPPFHSPNKNITPPPPVQHPHEPADRLQRPAAATLNPPKQANNRKPPPTCPAPRNSRPFIPQTRTKPP
jgi:hypothetical protein